MPVQYHIKSHPAAHVFEVSCTVASPDSRGQCFSLPAWIPGSYVIRDFAGNVVRLCASSDSGPVAVRKLDKQTWQCEPVTGALTVRYEVYAWDASVRTAYLDTTRGFFNGTSLFLRAEGHEGDACEVCLESPVDPVYANWRVATSMEVVDADSAGFGIYRAGDYAELLDHPAEMGAFDCVDFDVNGVPHHMVLAGRQRADQQRLARDLKVLCETHAALFADTRPPMDRYLFLTRVVGEGYGGLEHRASSSLICARHALPVSGPGQADKEYRKFLGLCSHEYFHVWNVKRICPTAFADADLRREAYTEDLWAYEGITAYYDDLGLVRAGLITPQQYLDLLAESATRLWRTPARHKQSLAESSFDAWIKFYKQGDNAPNDVVSYYNKGSLVALSLDLKLRLETEGRISLDDVMRALWREYGKPGQPVPERGIERVAQTVSGLNLQSFFDGMIRGLEEPPLAELLPHFGVNCRLDSASETDGKQARTQLGLTLRAGQPYSQIAHVLDGGPAQLAGLAPGDTLLALDGLQVQIEHLDARLAAIEPGESVEVHVFRRDELMRFTLTPNLAPKDTWSFRIDEDEADQAAQYRTTWLSYPENR